jgi:ABC-type branched-subunit amino acid transport system ATPase component
MKLFELEEAAEIVKSINGMLLLFSATPKTAEMLKEYLLDLIAELEDQDLLSEAEAEHDMEIDLSKQITFLNHLHTILDGKSEEVVFPSAKHSN